MPKKTLRFCTGMLAALCFVVGSLGSALGESKWSPELMDFTYLGCFGTNKQCQGHGGVLGDPTNKSCSENFTKEFYWYLGAAA